MQKFITDKFGYTIAFLLPGFLVIWAVSYYSSTITSWLNNTRDITSNIGNIVYIILASLSAGIIISAIRWIIYDRILFRKIDIKELDYSKLQANLDAYRYIIEGHYQFYQFYANMSVSILVCSILRKSFLQGHPWIIFWLVVIEVILFWNSKGCFNKCYEKLRQLLK